MLVVFSYSTAAGLNSNLWGINFRALQQKDINLHGSNLGTARNLIVSFPVTFFIAVSNP
jgi:hypothetical protein